MGEGLREGLVPYFAALRLGKDLDTTNRALLEILRTEDTRVQEKYRLNDPWCLATNLPDKRMALRFYRFRGWLEEMFGDFKKHGFHGSLDTATETQNHVF